MNREAVPNPLPVSGTATSMPMLYRAIRGQHFSAATPLPVSLQSLHFIDCTFRQMTLSDVQMQAIRFERCEFEQVSLTGGTLQQALFIDCRLRDIDLQHLHIAQLYAHRCEATTLRLAHCRLDRVDIQQGSWLDSEITDCAVALLTLVEVTLSGLHFGQVTARDWSLYRCVLTQCRWQACSMVRWVSGHSTFTACTLRLLPGKGPAWFRCQLTACEIRQQSLQQASFHQSELTGCNLSHSQLSATIFSGATLTDCVLDGCTMQAIQGEDSRFIHCTMSGVRWANARLQRAQFSDCVRDNGDWQQADLRASRWTENAPADPLASARLHGAQAPTEADEQRAEPVLQAIDIWYAQFQPGPDAGLSFPLLPSGASRYV